MEIKEFQSVLPEKKQQIAEKVQTINAVAKSGVRTSSRVARFTKEGLTSSQMKEGEEKKPTNNQFVDAPIGSFINQASRNIKGRQQERISSPEENVFRYHSQGNTFSKEQSVDTFCVQRSSPWEERISMYKKIQIRMYYQMKSTERIFLLWLRNRRLLLDQEQTQRHMLE